MSGTLDEACRRAATGTALSAWAEAEPDRTAITSPSGDRTFAQLDAGANRLVRALRARGIGPGSSLVLLCGNRPEFPEVVAACERGGYRITPVNWHLTAPEVAYIAGDCGASAIVADAAFAEVAAAVAAEVPALTARLAVAGPIEGFEPYEEALAAEDGRALDDPVKGRSMLYTSGTTGRPKGVHRDDSAPTTPASVAIYGYVPGEDAHLCTGPLYHAAPLAFSLSIPLLAGVRVVLMERWDAAEALRLVEAESITHSHLVPTMFHRLLALPEEVKRSADTSSLRFLLHGAAPCPVAVKQGIIDWLGPIVWEYYAATEGVGTFCDPHTWLAHPGTVGKPLLPGSLHVGDEEGRPLPPNEVGLVFLRAPAAGRFRYWGDDAKTAGSYRGDFFTLGDMGYLDDEGYLFLTDRSADLIISGGVNIYPAEVDAVLLLHPKVGDAGTIGVPNAEWGEEVVAVVEPAPGVQATESLKQELLGFCRERLAHYKCPRRVELVDELPRSDAGKMQRRLLRERYRQEVTA